MASIESKIKTDPELFNTFKANIAMAFKDEFERHNKKHGNKRKTREEVHQIANTAATNFLNLWVK